MRPIERRLGEVAEVMAGMTGLGDVGNYRYGVVQPNSFSDTGTIGAVEWQKRNDEISEKQKLMVGDILVKRLNPSVAPKILCKGKTARRFRFNLRGQGYALPCVDTVPRRSRSRQGKKRSVPLRFRIAVVVVKASH